MNTLITRIWKPGEIFGQKCLSRVYSSPWSKQHCGACFCFLTHLRQENKTENVSRITSLPNTHDPTLLNSHFIHTSNALSQTSNTTTFRTKLSKRQKKNFQSCRSIKQNGSKSYPSAHMYKLRELRNVFRFSIQKNAVKTREKLTLSRKEMKEKVEDRLEKAKILRENILTVPNLLTASRIVLSPVLGYLVINEHYMLGTGLFIFTGLTDLLDGYIARNFANQKSALGSILDPLADKCLVSILTISLTIAGLIPVPLTVLMFTRDISLIGASFYLRYKSLEAPFTWSGYFDVTHVTMKFSPTFISKVNTVVQLFLLGVTLPAPVFHYVDHTYLHYLWYATAVTTIWSGLSYIFRKDTFKLLGKTARGTKEMK